MIQPRLQDGKYQPIWPEEKVMRLKQLTDDGMSCQQIAIELGVSRNAVIGKQHRINKRSKFTQGQRVHNPDSNKPGRKYTRAPWAVPGLLANGKKVVSKLEHALLTDLPPEDVPNPVKLLDLDQHHCRWPVHAFGDPALFCGGEALKGYPYCGHHCRMAYTRAQTLNRAEQELIQRKMKRARDGKAQVAA